ncbi:ABC-F family ATP-binding cassette domain-containing protein [Nocardiopsis sp. RSe5-2]|uniref:ABC-F family ATP-binding cassette domain-containing protein n=1 Tax=Nocardiopsis endophytica TaxID=3018445 RepID=A0ABT4U412_9ACTN|nr:ABC-F family ATP-binding cassette domain-containing protein [Nocardiopsis endophytica]MDA2811190.1 ABC-F family ATP-binding cassette domain-containing protein [Nocardiopsis endophytica]
MTHVCPRTRGTRGKSRSADSGIVVTEAVKRYVDRIVLDRVSFTVRPGERVGVIGENGSGKSTLLRLLSGREEADAGAVEVRARGGVGYLPQLLDLPPQATVAQAIDHALADIRALERRIRSAEHALTDDADAMQEYGRLVEEFEARDGYGADARVDTALAALGLPGLDRGRALGTLSGGQRSRLALAGVLAADPEVLLLDEPTNDLDDGAVAWLEERLRRHRGTVVAVTHDREFLDRVTTAILEVDPDLRRVRRYGDGYTGYLRAKAVERERWAREYEEWKQEVARQRSLVASNAFRMDAIPRKQVKAAFGHGAFKLRSRDHGAASRIKMAQGRLERLTADPVPPPPEPLHFAVPTLRPQPVDSDPAVPLAVEAADLTVHGRLRLDGLRLSKGGRLLVTGPNGAGKTTLLRVLAGELAPDEGRVRVHGRVGHLRQQVGEGGASVSLLRAFADGLPGHPDDHASELLALGLFRKEDLRRPVGVLSVGQRRRLELARLVTRASDLLLLDEPTNHLSPLLVEEMQNALAEYEGTVVVTTHDRRLRAAFTGPEVHLSAA